MRRHACLYCLLLCLVLPHGAGASAQQPGDAELARQHYLCAEQFYESGEYERAYAEMSESYRLSRLADLLFNLGRIAEKLGRYADARRHLEQYLAERPDAADAAEIRARLRRFEELTGPAPPPPPPLKVKVESPAPPSRWPASLPPPGALSLLAGGAVVLMVGGTLGGLASVAAQQAERQGSDNERGQRLMAAGIALDVIGALSLSAGAAWTGYWLYTRQKGRSVPAALLPAGPGVVVIGRF